MPYNVFVRNWWKENPDWPGKLEPDPGAERTYLAYGLETEEEAQTMAKEYNATHDAGRLSRKAEYEVDPASQKYNGYPNYATWNVDLWVDNEQHTYEMKRRHITQGKKVVTARDVIRFVHIYLGSTTPDLDARDMSTVDYAYLAEQWENERQEELEYQNS